MLESTLQNTFTLGEQQRAAGGNYTNTSAANMQRGGELYLGSNESMSTGNELQRESVPRSVPDGRLNKLSSLSPRPCRDEVTKKSQESSVGGHNGEMVTTLWRGEAPVARKKNL